MTEGVCPALFERIFFRCFPQHASSSLNVFQWLPLFFLRFFNELLEKERLFAWPKWIVCMTSARRPFIRGRYLFPRRATGWHPHQQLVGKDGAHVFDFNANGPGGALKDNKSLTHSKPFLATRRTAAFLHLTVRSCSHSRHCYWKGVSSHFSLERRACPAETEGWPRKRYARTKLRWNEKRLNFFAVFDSIPTTFITSFLRFGFPHHPHNSQTLFFSSWALRPFFHMFVFVCVVRVPLGLVALCAHFYFAPVG